MLREEVRYRLVRGWESRKAIAADEVKDCEEQGGRPASSCGCEDLLDSR